MGESSVYVGGAWRWGMEGKLSGSDVLEVAPRVATCGPSCRGCLRMNGLVAHVAYLVKLPSPCRGNTPRAFRTLDMLIIHRLYIYISLGKYIFWRVGSNANPIVRNAQSMTPATTARSS